MKHRKHILTFILVLILGITYSQKNCDYPKEYVPKSIEDALLYLNCRWSEEDKENFRKKDENEAVAELHHGTGQSIRNYWGFWSKKENSLVKELQSYGFYHPDNMSGVILSLFHKQLNDSNLNIKKELLNYKRINKKIRAKEKLLENEIKRKYKKLSIGDTIKVPLAVTGKCKNGILFGVYSNWVTYDEYACIVTGIIKKKTSEGYTLTIEIIDIWFKNEEDYNYNYNRNKMNKGDIFTHEMKYFRTIIEKQ